MTPARSSGFAAAIPSKSAPPSGACRGWRQSLAGHLPVAEFRRRDYEQFRPPDTPAALEQESRDRRDRPVQQTVPVLPTPEDDCEVVPLLQAEAWDRGE